MSRRKNKNRGVQRFNVEPVNRATPANFMGGVQFLTLNFRFLCTD